jgi:tetratricopeptide (TPR) repeat protein/predicted Ser/Thr protein kinase
MTETDRRTVHEIFSAVCELDAAEREAALQRLCGADTALRAEVERLLALDQATGWLGEGELAALRQTLQGDPAEALPEALGDFLIEGLLGRGGMGVVYRGRQRQPDRPVALKVLPPAASPEAARRFAFEAEALGRLQHPGIAQIFAAGSFATGSGSRPYLAMELVEGRDLAGWLRAGVRSRRQRIELLIAVCEAVHHAHQKGIVHRDLKPGNVLVDRDGRPKVVDFGIARLVEDGDRQATMAGQVLGTLAYMSPEQADGLADQIDTRADVYALGVIGYQMLCGELPIDPGTESITRGIRRLVEDPPVPLGDRDPTLRGDLQMIFGRCLEKAPDRRYSSAMALAEDLRRHLADQPVLAREPSTLYVLHRLARRHRVLLGAAAVAFLSLAAGLWISLRATADAREAGRREALARRTAEAEAAESRRQLAIRAAVLDFMSDTFEETDPSVNPDARQMSTADVFASAAGSIATRFGDAPLVEKAVRLEVGRLLKGLGAYGPACEQLELAWAIPPAAEDPWQHLAVGFELGTALGEHDRPQEAADLLVEVGDRARALVAAGREPPAEFGPMLLHIGHAEGQVRFLLGDQRQAEQLWRETIAEAERDPATADCVPAALARSGLASVLIRVGELEEAETLVRRAIGALTSRHGRHHEQTLAALNNLAGLHMAREEFDAAARLYRDGLERFERIYGEGHPELIATTQNLAVLEWRTGAQAEAIARLHRLVEAAEAAGRGDTIGLVAPHANLGKMQWDLGQLEDGAEHYQRAIDIRLATSPESDVPLSGLYTDLARIRLAQGRPDEHLELFRTAVRIRIEALGPLHPKVLPRRVDLAAAELYAAGDVDEALAHLQAVDPLLVPELGPQQFASVYSQQLLAECLLRQGRHEAARVHVERLAERGQGHRDAARWATVVQQLRERIDQRER